MASRKNGWFGRRRLGLEILEPRETPIGTFGGAFGFGATGNETALAIETDNVGNLYVTGHFENTVDFDPGPGTFNLTAVTVPHMYVAKYTGAGALVWAVAIGGGGGGTEGKGIAVDAAGNVYVTGSFNGTAVDFDPGPGTFTLNAVGYQAFVCKLDGAGGFVWAASFGGNGDDVGKGIAVDAAGDVITTGTFQVTADFDPGPGTFNLVGIFASQDIYVSKLDSAGNFVWAKAMGTNLADTGTAVDVDSAGNVYTAGSFTGTGDFDPGPGTVTLTATGGQLTFITKFDSAGNLLWVAQIGGASPDNGLDLDVDAAGNVYTAGTTLGTNDYDPGPGTYNRAGGYFVTKLDTSGNFVWANAIGNGGYETCYGISVDGSGNVYTTGSTWGLGDFDPGAGTFDPPDGIFVQKLNSTGSFGWVVVFTGTGAGGGNAIVVDNRANVISTGTFSSTFDFDPGPGTANLSGVFGDAYISTLIDSNVLITPSSTSTSVSEAGTTDDYTVQLQLAPTANVIVTLTPDPRLSAGPLTLTFTPANWNTPQTVTLSTTNDLIAQGVYAGAITHSASSADINYNAIAIPRLFVDIIDNDTASVRLTESGGSTSVTEAGAVDSFTMVLTSQPTANVVVSLNPGTQLSVVPNALTFTPGNWATPQTVSAGALDDAAIEGTHNGILSVAVASTDLIYNGLAIPALTASITDNDGLGVNLTPTAGSTDVGESGVSDSYSVVLNALPTANVVITLNAAAQLMVLPARVTFTPANWNSPQNINIVAIDDAVAQGPHTAIITHTATSADAGYNGIAIANLTANISDNDAAAITFVPTTVDLVEGGLGNTFTAVLNSQPTANVVVALGGDSQVSLGSPSLIFTPATWNVRQTVTVTAVDDAIAEGNHVGLITYSAASVDTGYNGMNGTVTARIADNENPGVLISETNGPITILEGTSKTYTAVLNSPPRFDVVLNVRPDAQVQVSPTSITFTPGDWNVPRPIVVLANDDTDSEGDHLGSIRHDTASADSAFDRLTVATVTTHLVDNDGSFAIGSERNDQILVAFTPDRIQVTVNGKASTFATSLTQLIVFAGAGNDNIQIMNPTIPIVVVGGAGVDKVFVSGQTVSNAFVVGDSFVAVNGNSVGVWEIEGLTVGGKSGADSFTVLGVPAFATELKGDAGNDIVLGPARPNSWQITAANIGTLNGIKINGIKNWTGNTSVDAFAFAPGKSLSGQIDGGGGPDSLDYSAFTSAVNVNLQTRTATGIKSFVNIANVVGGKGAADKLVAADVANAWNITGAGAGTVNAMSFRNMENLTGGSQADTFRFSDGQGIKGKIDGGAGQDQLDFSAYLSRTVLINLQAKSATGIGGFLNMETILGGSGTNDILIGANQANTWSLTGSGAGAVASSLALLDFDGFENLTGGSLTDTFTLDAAGDWFGILNGGNGQDLLRAFPGTNQWVTFGIGTTGTLNGRKFAGIEVRR